jgi:hypothetical protein
VHDHVAAFDVSQEVQAESLAGARSGDESGDIGHGEAVLAGLDDPEVGDQGREGVVGDLGAGRAHGRDQAGLAGAREADQGHVRDGLQFEDQVALLPFLTEQGEAGCLAFRGGEGRVAEPALAAPGRHVTSADPDQVREDVPVLRGDHRAVGDGQDQVLTVRAVAHVALAEPAGGRDPVRPMVVGEQGGRGGVDLEDHVSAATSIGPVGAGQGLELLTADGGRAVSAVPTHGMQDHPVHEARHAHPSVRGSVPRSMWKEGVEPCSTPS